MLPEIAIQLVRNRRRFAMQVVRGLAHEVRHELRHVVEALAQRWNANVIRTKSVKQVRPQRRWIAMCCRDHARIEAFGRGHERLGRIEMMIGRRNYAYYFTDDPVLGQISAGATPRPQLAPA